MLRRCFVRGSLASLCWFLLAVMPLAAQDTLTHTVSRGENLYRISQRYGVTVEAISAVNGITDPSRIFVGQVLVIPAAGAVFVPSTPQPLPTGAASTFAAASDGLPLYPTPDFQPTATPPGDLGIVIVAPAASSSVPIALNGVPLESVIVLPPNVIRTARMIFAIGQSFGRNARAFSKLGDSTIENPYFMARFDTGPYDLGPYAGLQPTIDFFKGSFARESVAVRRGLHSWSVYDPMWASGLGCLPRETILACEIRLNNPSILFIKLGSNDVGVPESFDRNMRQIVTDCLNAGIIPVLSTKADRHEGSNQNNDMIRQIAAEFAIPLWDFDLLAGTLPNRGLDADAVHLTTFYAHDWNSPVGLTRGYGLYNLTGLMMLDALWRAVST